MRRRELFPVLLLPALMRVGSASEKPRTSSGERVRVTAWLGEGALETGTIEATVEGRSAKVVGVHAPSTPLLLQLALDLTGDIALIEPARTALKEELRALPASVWVGLLRAQDGLRVLADPGAERDQILRLLDELNATGHAGLLDVVEPLEQVAQRVLRRAGVRTAVLCLTDSNIYNYREDYTNPVINPSDQRDLSRRFPEALIREKTAKLAAAVNSFDAPLFIEHLAWLRDRLNEAYQAGLQKIAEATGGSATFSRTPGEIAGDLGRILQKITSHWAVDVELPAGTPRTFTVQLAVPGREIQYRTKFTLAARGKPEGRAPSEAQRKGS